MTLPNNLPDALAMIGSLLHDGNLWLGLQTVAVILVGSGLITWILLSKVVRRG